jgi:hypothetical protein
MATSTNNSSNVSVGKPKATGAVFFAPKGTAVPTDATTELSDAFKGVGYVSEDGVTNEVETDTEEIKAWGGDVVATPQTSYSEKFTLTLIETSANTLKVVYGDDKVTVDESTGVITINHNSAEKTEMVMVIEVVMNDDRIKRIVVPKCKLIEMGEITYKDDEAIGYECTFQALPDTNGNSSTEYIATTA